MKRIVWIDRDELEWGCWLSSSRYARIGGKPIHQEFAAGEGVLVRHLCCNAYCCNPRHFLRGSYKENGEDERLKHELLYYIVNYTNRWRDHSSIEIEFRRYMKKMIKKDGILFLSVPIGPDKLVWNSHRIYGRIRFPMLIKNWSLVDSSGFEEENFDAEDVGVHQPVFVLKNI